LPRTGNLGGKFLVKPKFILGCSADYDDDEIIKTCSALFKYL
jgi:hypothetical protein